MNKLALIALLFLYGCVSVENYQVYIVEVKDQAVLASDLKTCLGYAQAYKQGLDLGAVGSKTAEGVGSNLSEGALNWEAPLLGGIGQGGSELFSQLGLTSTKQILIYVKCLTKKGDRSGAYMVLDPAVS